MGVHALLDFFHLLDQVRGAYRSADPHTWGDDLRKTVHQNHVARLVKVFDWRLRPALDADIAIGVILQHDHIVYAG